MCTFEGEEQFQFNLTNVDNITLMLWFYCSIYIFFFQQEKIPFSQVNDDYCDCHDSTDEPGTSACPNAKYLFLVTPSLKSGVTYLVKYVVLLHGCLVVDTYKIHRISKILSDFKNSKTKMCFRTLIFKPLPLWFSADLIWYIFGSPSCHSSSPYCFFTLSFNSLYLYQFISSSTCLK